MSMRAVFEVKHIIDDSLRRMLVVCYNRESDAVMTFGVNSRTANGQEFLDQIKVGSRILNIIELQP